MISVVPEVGVEPARFQGGQFPKHLVRTAKLSTVLDPCLPTAESRSPNGWMVYVIARPGVALWPDWTVWRHQADAGQRY